jgi:hypothetical protein
VAGAAGQPNRRLGTGRRRWSGLRLRADQSPAPGVKWIVDSGGPRCWWGLRRNLGGFTRLAKVGESYDRSQVVVELFQKEKEKTVLESKTNSSLTRLQSSPLTTVNKA